MRQKQDPQEIQDEIFRKMTPAKKLRLASDLTQLCIRLHCANGNYKSRTISRKARSIT